MSSLQQSLGTVHQSNYQRAMAQIRTSDLPSSTKAAAYALLEHASADSGHLKADWDLILTLCERKSRGGARQHLTRLRAENIIHYSTNDYVYVDFTAWQALSEASNRRVEASNRRVDEIESVPADEVKIGGVHRIDAPKHRSGRSGASVSPTTQVGRYLPSSSPQENFDLPKHQEPQMGEIQGPSLAAHEIETSKRLLSDPKVGLKARRQICKLAEENRLANIRLHVFAYLEDRKKGKVQGAGALVNRLNNPHQFDPGRLTQEDMNSDLYRRYLLPDESERDDLLVYIEQDNRSLASQFNIPAEYADLINT